MAGIHQLYLSTDVYHQERVPVEYVYHAIDAALELKVPRISLTITYATGADRDAVAAQYERYGDSVDIMWQLLIPNRITRVTMRGHSPVFRIVPEHYGIECWLGTPLINPNGDIFACHIGKAAAHRSIRDLPYFLGNLREASFSEVMALAGRRPDYQFLRTHGPRGVAEVAATDPSIAEQMPRHDFTSGCDMCMCVMLAPSTPAALEAHAAKETEEIDVRLALLWLEEPVFGTHQPLPRKSQGD